MAWHWPCDCGSRQLTRKRKEHDMMIEGRHCRDVLVLEIAGALRWEQKTRPPSVRKAVEQSLVAGVRRIVVDLSHVSVMDSSALGDLAAGVAAAEAAGCELRLSGPRPSVRELLRAMGLAERVPVDADEAAALRALGVESTAAGREENPATTPPGPRLPRAARGCLP
jgi:anti-anti-sigma factor